MNVRSCTWLNVEMSLAWFSLASPSQIEWNDFSLESVFHRFGWEWVRSEEETFAPFLLGFGLSHGPPIMSCACGRERCAHVCSSLHRQLPPSTKLINLSFRWEITSAITHLLFYITWSMDLRAHRANASERTESYLCQFRFYLFIYLLVQVLLSISIDSFSGVVAVLVFRANFMLNLFFDFSVWYNKKSTTFRSSLLLHILRLLLINWKLFWKQRQTKRENRYLFKRETKFRSEIWANSE